ncbi:MULTISPECIES: hypothetical protein [Clostridium]|uniref:hypothetical protein n=1 Tax=Clostridium TaxID=1485 RepID=UPI000824489B|nr:MULTISPECIES: hypothetical protein [Clostridium]PJI10558.1 hypothetical protein CUB90_00760 [Clostridium sp. CT7]
MKKLLTRVSILLAISILLTGYYNNKITKAISVRAKQNNSVKYNILQKKYQVNNNGKNITIKYPQISGLSSAALQKCVNNLIKNRALEVLSRFSGNTKYTITVENNISLSTEKILSIKYTGLFSSPDTAYPTNLFYTSNINLTNCKELSLKSIVRLDKNFIDTLKNSGTIVNSSSESKELLASQKYILNNISIDTLNLKSSYFYLTNDSIGISIEVPHALGDHMEIEMTYKNAELIKF